MGNENYARRNIVLVVDDEPTIIRALTSALANSEFRALVAENGAAGLELFYAHKNEICLALIDVIMPVMGGVELAERITSESPSTKILLMTGYSQRVIDNTSGRFPILRKPFLPDNLIMEIQRILEA